MKRKRQLERLEEEGESLEEGKECGGCRALHSYSPRGRGRDDGEGYSQVQAEHLHGPAPGTELPAPSDDKLYRVSP